MVEPFFLEPFCFIWLNTSCTFKAYFILSGFLINYNTRMVGDSNSKDFCIIWTYSSQSFPTYSTYEILLLLPILYNKKLLWTDMSTILLNLLLARNLTRHRVKISKGLPEVFVLKNHQILLSKNKITKKKWNSPKKKKKDSKQLHILNFGF